MAREKGLRAASECELTEEERIQIEQFDYVRFTVCDINGIGRCKAVPRKHLQAAIERGGLDIYAGVLALGPRSQLLPMDEVLQINNGNVLMAPVSGTLRPLPWATEDKFKVAEVLCETYWIKPFRDGSPQAACPRTIARRQLAKLNDLGYSLRSGFEPEFTAFRRGTNEPIFRGSDIFSCRDFAEFESYMYELDSGLREAGVDCGVLETEYASGQFEFPTAPRTGIESADMLFRLKGVVKELSLKKDIEVTFMTQPVLKCFNNGLHFSHSLLDNKSKTNAFLQVQSEIKKLDPVCYMSGTLTAWLGGLLRHAGSLTALCCPTVNCYRRLGTPWTPAASDWGVNDRFRAFRVKTGTNEQQETYLENRIPSGAANPYIILAATIAAGMSGLSNPVSTLPPQGEGVALPKTLEEALVALEADDIMVEALGEEFVRWFCKTKRELEVQPLKDDDFSKELDMYYKML